MSTPLKDLLSKAAEILGEPIDHMTVCLVSGSRIRVVGEPQPSVVEAPKLDSRIRNWIPRIEAFLKDQSLPMQRKQIALHFEREAGKEPKGDATGWLGKAIGHLIETKQIDEDDDRYLVWSGSGPN